MKSRGEQESLARWGSSKRFLLNAQLMNTGRWTIKLPKVRYFVGYKSWGETVSKESIRRWRTSRSIRCDSQAGVFGGSSGSSLQTLTICALHIGESCLPASWLQLLSKRTRLMNCRYSPLTAPLLTTWQLIAGYFRIRKSFIDVIFIIIIILKKTFYF